MGHDLVMGVVCGVDLPGRQNMRAASRGIMGGRAGPPSFAGWPTPGDRRGERKECSTRIGVIALAAVVFPLGKGLSEW